MPLLGVKHLPEVASSCGFLCLWSNNRWIQRDHKSTPAHPHKTTPRKMLRDTVYTVNISFGFLLWPPKEDLPQNNKAKFADHHNFIKHFCNHCLIRASQEFHKGNKAGFVLLLQVEKLGQGVSYLPNSLWLDNVSCTSHTSKKFF